MKEVFSVTWMTLANGTLTKVTVKYNVETLIPSVV